MEADEPSQVISKAEKLRRRLTGSLEKAMDQKWKMSVAVGVSLFPDHAGCCQRLLQAAEDALARSVAIRGVRFQIYYPIFNRLSGAMNKNTKRQREIITKAIRDKDRVIYGHSERAFFYTQLNCREFGLSAGKSMPIECAAILHDNITTMDKKSAKFALEITKQFNTWLDHAQKENCDSLRLIIDHSTLDIRGMELYLWEKVISRCAKNLEVVILCHYDVNSLKLHEDIRAIEQLHDCRFTELH